MAGSSDAPGTKLIRVHAPHWVQVGGGQLAVWHRPKVKSMPMLQTVGGTHVLTLLSAREGAEMIGAAVVRAGLAWHWLPLDNGSPPAEQRDGEVSNLLREMSALIDQGASVLIHCSAGIHRTGMIAHALLRLRGLSHADALTLLTVLRQKTGLGVGEGRLQWAERLLGSR